MATQSYIGINVKDLEVNLKEMCLLADKHIPEESLCFDMDSFFDVKMKSGVTILEGIYDITDQQFVNQVFWTQKERLRTYSTCNTRGGSYNCLWGFVFSPRKDNEFSKAVDYFQYRLSSIRSSQTHETFWELKHYNYPSLVFADSIADNVSGLKDESLDIIIGGLEKLEKISSKWHSGATDDIIAELGQLGNRYTGESESTRNDEELMKMRDFDFGKGRGVVRCEKHLKLSEYMRIHIYPDYNTKNICIGYAGPHLPVSSKKH